MVLPAAGVTWFILGPPPFTLETVAIKIIPALYGRVVAAIMAGLFAGTTRVRITTPKTRHAIDCEVSGPRNRNWHQIVTTLSLGVEAHAQVLYLRPTISSSNIQTGALNPVVTEFKSITGAKQACDFAVLAAGLVWVLVPASIAGG